MLSANSPGSWSSILLAEDDEDDRLLLKEALLECRIEGELHIVGDGEELLDYLRRSRKYEKLSGSPLPRLIILDLNMPRKDGREALREIKADPKLCTIPIVILTSSLREEDVRQSYDLGVSSFIVKPMSFETLVDLARTLKHSWIEAVEPPPAQMAPWPDAPPAVEGGGPRP